MSSVDPFSSRFEVFGREPRYLVEEINQPEFEKLSRLVRKDAAGEGRIILLRAPRAGFGKTMLLKRVAAGNAETHQFIKVTLLGGRSIEAAHVLEATLHTLSEALPGSGGLTILDLVARRILARGLEPLVRSGEVPCKDRDGAVRALREQPVETFDFHHERAVTAHWTKTNFEILGPRLASELALLSGAGMRESSYWVELLFRFATTPPDNVERTRLLFETIFRGDMQRQSRSGAGERLHGLLTLMSAVIRPVLVIDDTEGLSTHPPDALELASFLTNVTQNCPQVVVVMSVNHDVWETAFLPRLPGGLADRLTEHELILEPLTREKAEQLITSRAGTRGPEIIKKMEWDGKELYARDVLKSAARIWDELVPEAEREAAPAAALAPPQPARDEIAPPAAQAPPAAAVVPPAAAAHASAVAPPKSPFTPVESKAPESFEPPAGSTAAGIAPPSTPSAPADAGKPEAGKSQDSEPASPPSPFAPAEAKAPEPPREDVSPAAPADPPKSPFAPAQSKALEPADAQKPETAEAKKPEPAKAGEAAVGNKEVQQPAATDPANSPFAAVGDKSSAPPAIDPSKSPFAPAESKQSPDAPAAKEGSEPPPDDPAKSPFAAADPKKAEAKDGKDGKPPSADASTSPFAPANPASSPAKASSPAAGGRDAPSPSPEPAEPPVGTPAPVSPAASPFAPAASGAAPVPASPAESPFGKAASPSPFSPVHPPSASATAPSPFAAATSESAPAGSPFAPASHSGGESAGLKEAPAQAPKNPAPQSEAPAAAPSPFEPASGPAKPVQAPAAFQPPASGSVPPPMESPSVSPEPRCKDPFDHTPSPEDEDKVDELLRQFKERYGRDE
ncbi:MAG: hypothetical protein HKN82_10285 [Akkermansiaceae bacterium]|nr:hypothetical protein [Akkermansiaceae bacterium]